MIVFFQENLEIFPDGGTVYSGTRKEKVNGKNSSAVFVQGIQYTDLSNKECSIDCTFIGSTTLLIEITKGECDNTLETFSHVAAHIGENWYYYRKKWSIRRKKVNMKIMFMLPIPEKNKVLVSFAN